MAKLFMSADKVKKVLSANEMIPVYVQSVDQDIDFKGTKVNRKDLEKMGAENLAKVLDPIHTVLKDAGLDPLDVDVVELLGGGLRVPKVQKLLCDLFKCTDKENGVETAVHLNGDEAMALGAAFIAANKSTAFVVRHVGVGDTSPLPVGVRLKQIGNETNEKGKTWSKRASLYKRNNKLKSRKVVTFKYDKSFRVEVHYEKHKSVPEGTPKILTAYEVTGVEDIVTNDKYKDLGTPKIKVSFFLDGNQMVSVLKADAYLDEIVEEEVQVEITEEEETDESKEGEDEKKEETEKKEGEDEKKEGEDEKKEEEAEKKEGEAEKKEGEDEKKEEAEKKEGEDEKKEEQAEKKEEEAEKKEGESEKKEGEDEKKEGEDEKKEGEDETTEGEQEEEEETEPEIKYRYEKRNRTITHSIPLVLTVSTTSLKSKKCREKM